MLVRDETECEEHVSPLVVTRIRFSVDSMKSIYVLNDTPYNVYKLADSELATKAELKYLQ